MYNLGKLETIIKPDSLTIFFVSILKIIFWLLLLFFINNILIYYCLKYNKSLEVPNLIFNTSYLFYFPFALITIVHKMIVFKSKPTKIELYQNGLKINDFISLYKDLQVKVYPSFVEKKLFFFNNMSEEFFYEFITEKQVKFILNRIKFN